MDPLASLFARFAARGDVDALGAVFDQTAPRLLRLAMHLAHGAEDAEDLLQATFVLAMRKAPTFATDQPLLPWLAGLLAGEARNLARKNVRRRTEPLPDLADTGADGGPIASAERGELVARLRARVEDLPTEQRQALLLQLQHGLSPTDIAEVLEVPPGTVRMRLHRGLSALRRLLPSALAVWLFGAFGTRGLAAVRTAVLREANAVARAASVSGTAAIAAGVLSMKYVFAGVAAVLAALLCWWIAQPAAIAPIANAPHEAGVASATMGPNAAAPSAVARVGANEAPPPLPDGTGALCVQVTGAGSKLALVDVAVRVWPGTEQAPDDGSAPLARTDGNGTVRFRALQPGTWQVDVIGFKAPATSVRVESGTETSQPIALATVPLRGVVVDENGTAVAGAAVRVGSLAANVVQADDTRPGLPPRTFVRTAATSGTDGTFACEAGDQENYVAAAHPQFTSSQTQLTHALIREWRLVLQARAREIRGVVRGAGQQPVAGATVLARVLEQGQRMRDGTFLGPTLMEFATTDAAGRFAFESLPAGDARLEANAPGHTGRDAFVRADARPDDVEIVLPAARELLGVVREADGTPLPTGWVSVGSIATARIRGGRFTLCEPPPPPFVLSVYVAGGSAAALERAVDRVDAATIELVLPPRPTLRGTIVDEAQNPLAKWTVVAHDLDAPAAARSIASATTDAEGRFALRHLAADRLRLAAQRTSTVGGQPAISRDDVSAFAGEVVLRVPADRMPRASVAGRIVDGAGQPVAGTVTVHSRTRELHGSAATATDGTFRIQGLPDGRYWLTFATANDPARTLQGGKLDGTSAVELGDLCVLPLATLRVEVVHRDGTPWRQMLPNVFVQPPGKGRTWLSPVGEGRLDGKVEPGAMRVAIETTDLFASPLEIELLPGGTGSLRLPVDVGRRLELVFAGDRDAKIDPNDVLRLEVTDERGAVVHRDEVRRSPHGDGTWTLDHTFAFGSYEVTARTDSDRRYRVKFVVDDARSSPRRIEVPRLP